MKKLRVISILWCGGGLIEQASELFNIIEEKDKSGAIDPKSDHFKSTMHLLFYTATEMVFLNEPIFMITAPRCIIEE